MTAEGFFHDAHEVYSRNPRVGIPDWRWMATFPTKDLAAVFVEYLAQSSPDGQEYEVRPV